jgi:hypothetical protein
MSALISAPLTDFASLARVAARVLFPEAIPPVTPIT